METTALVVEVIQDIDTRLFVSNIDGGLDIEMNFVQPTLSQAKGGACTVIVGSNGDPDEGFTDDEWTGLLDELTASWLRNTINMKIDKNLLGSRSDGHRLNSQRDGTFDDESTGTTSIMHGSPFDQVTPARVRQVGPDKFEFTGPVVVTAGGVGRKGKRGRRAIACGGDDGNKVTATVTGLGL